MILSELPVKFLRTGLDVKSHASNQLGKISKITSPSIHGRNGAVDIDINWADGNKSSHPAWCYDQVEVVGPFPLPID